MTKKRKAAPSDDDRPDRAWEPPDAALYHGPPRSYAEVARLRRAAAEAPEGSLLAGLSRSLADTAEHNLRAYVKAANWLRDETNAEADAQRRRNVEAARSEQSKAQTRPAEIIQAIRATCDAMDPPVAFPVPLGEREAIANAVVQMGKGRRGWGRSTDLGIMKRLSEPE